MIRIDIFLMYDLQIWKGKIKIEKNQKNIQNIMKSQKDMIKSKINLKDIKNIKKEEHLSIIFEIF